MTLHDHTVLVLGGSGQVGAPIVTRLLADGARVVVPSRDTARAREVLGTDERLTLVAGELGEDGASDELRTAIVAAVPQGLGDVVVSVGGWWSGDRIVDLDPAELDRVLARGYGAHLRAARTFLPLLAASDATTTWTMINGGAATEPVAGSGAVSISAAAQLMLGRVLAMEHADDDVAVRSLVLQTPVRTRDREGGQETWLTGNDVAAAVAVLIAGSDAGPVVTLDDHEGALAFAAG